MDILKLMEARHSVRRYLDKPIEEDKKRAIIDYIEMLNARYGTNLQAFFNDAEAFKNAEASYGIFKGCKNHIALVGKSGETCGYAGELIALKLQGMGLNSCFVALTYKKGAVKKKVSFNAGEKLICDLAIGYGEDQGVPHKNKKTEVLTKVVGEKAPLFDLVVKACLFAPTAINQQKFLVISDEGAIVVKKRGIGFYTDVDLGIVKAHKDLVTGAVEL